MTDEEESRVLNAMIVGTIGLGGCAVVLLRLAFWLLLTVLAVGLFALVFG